MSIDTEVTFSRIPILKPRNPKMGRPRAPLPQGLDDGAILRLRRKAEKLSFSNCNASFAILFATACFGALAERGYARLSRNEILELAKLCARDKPAALSVIITSFLAAHPPIGATYLVMVAAIKAGAIGGERGLIDLHHHIREAARKRAAKRWKLAPPPSPDRPKLLSKAERLAVKQQLEAKAIEAETKQANEALAKLYNRRFAAEMKPHLEFVEVCQALRDAGYGLVDRHRATLIELAAEMSV